MLNASIGQVETMEIVKVLYKDTLVTARKTYDRFAMANVFYDFPISIILQKCFENIDHLRSYQRNSCRK